MVIDEKVNDDSAALLCDLDYLFSKLSKLAKSIKNTRIQKADDIFTQLDKFAKEIVNDEFDNAIKSAITEDNETKELNDALEMSHLEIQSNMKKINELMVGLSQYDDLVCNTKEDEDSFMHIASDRSPSKTSKRSRSRSPSKISKRSLSRSPSKTRKRSRSRSPNSPNKKMITGGKKRITRKKL